MGPDVSEQEPTRPSRNDAFRTPRRISITLPYGTYARLLDRSNREGRSLSNLAAFLLESCTGSEP
ncbi:MAG: ribbon-helix-helix domain-containing protein [Cyanobium sp.]